MGITEHNKKSEIHVLQFRMYKHAETLEGQFPVMPCIKITIRDLLG